MTASEEQIEDRDAEIVSDGERHSIEANDPCIGQPNGVMTDAAWQRTERHSQNVHQPFVELSPPCAIFI
jgi:hypothetical protein